MSQTSIYLLMLRSDIKHHLQGKTSLANLLLWRLRFWTNPFKVSLPNLTNIMDISRSRKTNKPPFHTLVFTGSKFNSKHFKIKIGEGHLFRRADIEEFVQKNTWKFPKRARDSDSGGNDWIKNLRFLLDGASLSPTSIPILLQAIYNPHVLQLFLNFKILKFCLKLCSVKIYEKK